jgi:exodeoxyribonuclease-3
VAVKPFGALQHNPRMLRVVTANVNGIRAALRRGGIDWLVDAQADVICLQEVRATTEQLHEALAGTPLADWHIAHSASSALGRNGVSILSREQPTAVRIGKKVEEFDHQGRWIEVDLDTAVGPLTVASVYVHTGDSIDADRQAEKYRFLDAMDARMAALARRAKRSGREAILCGDLNVAHTQQDIKNWKGNRGKAGFLEDERAYFDRWFAKEAWVDLGRHFGGVDADGPYTWWTWRGQAFDKDVGWRIDYMLATKALAALATGSSVGRAATYAERWSDHAPVVADFA